MSDKRVHHPGSPTSWGAVFSFAIIGMVFAIGLSLPQQTEAGAALPRLLLFQSPIGRPSAPRQHPPISPCRCACCRVTLD